MIIPGCQEIIEMGKNYIKRCNKKSEYIWQVTKGMKPIYLCKDHASIFKDSKYLEKIEPIR